MHADCVACLQAAFDCDIDVATRLYQEGARLPELSSLIHHMASQQLPTETEVHPAYPCASPALYPAYPYTSPARQSARVLATLPVAAVGVSSWGVATSWVLQATAIYGVEGLRRGSAEGQGATAAIMEVHVWPVHICGLCTCGPDGAGRESSQLWRRCRCRSGVGVDVGVAQVLMSEWQQLPDLGSTLKSVCMVADAEFSETKVLWDAHRHVVRTSWCCAWMNHRAARGPP